MTANVMRDFASPRSVLARGRARTTQRRDRSMKQVSTIGLDLAKHVFQVLGADNEGSRVFNRKLRRNEVLRFFGRLPPCLVGMEECGAAHYRGRETANASVLSGINQAYTYEIPHWLRVTKSVYSYSHKCERFDDQNFCPQGSLSRYSNRVLCFSKPADWYGCCIQRGQ